VAKQLRNVDDVELGISEEPHSAAANRPRQVRLTSDQARVPLSPIDIASFIVATVGLILVLELKLLGALLAGLLVYQLVHMLAPLIERRMPSQAARWLAVVLLSVVIVGALTGAVLGIISRIQHDVPSVQMLLDRLMHFIDQTRSKLPEWTAAYLPYDTSDMKETAIAWVQSHVGMLQQSGRDAARGITHVLIGMILGAMVAVGTRQHAHRQPLAAALVTRVGRLADAFRRIVFAQVKISAINTCFTGFYLMVILPAFHTHLPLSKTITLAAFLLGLLPVIGNLMSNAIIIIVSLSVGLPTAIASFVFLVLIHKFEYFLNARIVGGEIEAKAWELLVAMLAMEAAFGVFGVIAAPIYYAYIKRELIAMRLV
jgi:predicted PurR-regulated permease PerM